MVTASSSRAVQLCGPAMTPGLHPVPVRGPLDEVFGTVGEQDCLVATSDRDDVVVAGAVAAQLGTHGLPGALMLLGDKRPDPAAVELWRTHCPGTPLVWVAPGPESTGRHPEAGAPGSGPAGDFLARLQGRARSHPAHIVLPEGTEPRILQASARILADGLARVTLLGDPARIAAEARACGADIEGADVVDPATSTLRDRFAARYAEIRKAKGITLEQARERMADVSYFGTMMVEEGLADGMVSGAVHTTADTIRPAFEIIRTAPGGSVVSSVFLMCLRDQVLVYGDCAVNPNPGAEQLAEIAVASARTAAQFGISPRVAMLSYSTGASGKGPDVDLVVEATRLARAKDPTTPIDGPLQYDAAVCADVARTKAPDSPVAGKATVLVFPDLTAGNITYKAVQRSSGALAIGPVLQGLRKPVNDLSRGATVDDVVNTILITAVQAKGDAS